MITNWDGDTLFERYGSVETDARAPTYLGSVTRSNNTGELTAFGKLLIYAIRFLLGSSVRSALIRSLMNVLSHGATEVSL